MSDKVTPPLFSGQIISVDGIKCVVRKVYEKKSTFGACEVVFNTGKPTSHDIGWDGKKFFFEKRSDFGGYVHESDKYLQILKNNTFI